MKKLLLIASVLFIGCKHDSIEQKRIGDFNVELLFEKDGCKIYRFNDGRTVYWSDCRGQVNSSYTTQSGKHNRTTHYQDTLNSGR